MRTILLSTVLAIVALGSTAGADTYAQRAQKRNQAWIQAHPSGATGSGQNGVYYRDKNGAYAAASNGAQVAAVPGQVLGVTPSGAPYGAVPGLVVGPNGTIIWCPPDNPTTCLAWDKNGNYAYVPKPQ